MTQERVAEVNRGFFIKTGDNRTTGLNIDGYRPFTGYVADASKSIYNLAVVYDQKTQEEIARRVTEPLKKFAAYDNLPYIFANGEDMTSHTVVDAAVFRGLSPEQIDAVLSWMKSPQSGIPEIESRFENQIFPLPDLVMGSRSYIGARFDVQQILALGARFDIEEARARAMVELGNGNLGPANFAEPYSYKAIWHSSIASTTAKPNFDATLRLIDWAYETIGRSLQKDPIEARTGSVFSGSALRFQLLYSPPGLVK